MVQRTIQSLIAIAIIALAACTQYSAVTARTPRAVIDVCIDDAFVGAEMIAVSDAVYDWNKVLQPTIDLRPQTIDVVATPRLDECRIYLLRVTSSTPWVGTQLHTNDLGVVNATPGRYAWIVVDRKPEFLRTVVAHEIGHLLGLVHTEDGLMSPYADGSGQRPTTREAVEAAYLLGGE